MAINCKDVKIRLGSKISRFTATSRTSRGSAKSWTISGAGLRNISLSTEAEMWAGIRKEWDYLALAFLLGMYLTAGVAVALTLWALCQSF